jgi:hypothetical protein
MRAALILLAAAAAPFAAMACGGDNDDAAQPTATVQQGGADGGGQPTRPADTSTPGPSDTPEPTATSTPEPSPTPAELTFTVADGADGSNTPRSSGPLGIVYAEAGFGHDASANRIEAFALVNVGINEHPTGSAWIWNDFRAPGEGSAAIGAQISTDVIWKGVLAGNGAGGTSAAVTITLSVVEDGRTIVSEVVHTLEHRESVLTGGGFDDIGSAPADLQVSLVPGRLYQLRLTLTCASSSGLIGAATHCQFSDNDLYDDGYVDWGPRSILFTP